MVEDPGKGNQRKELGGQMWGEYGQPSLKTREQTLASPFHIPETQPKI